MRLRIGDGGTGIGSGRKGSVLAEHSARAAERGDDGGEPAFQALPSFPTNEEVVKALQERVEVRLVAAVCGG